MAEPFFLELQIKPIDNEWTAHKRRDFIEQAVEKVTLATPQIFMRMLQTTSSDFRTAIDAHPTERLFRLSFPGYGSDVLTMKVSPVYPDGLVTSLHDQTMNKVMEAWAQRDKTMLAKGFDWLTKKVVGEQMFQAVNKEVLDQELSKASEKVRSEIEDTWNSNSFVPFVSVVGDWLISQGYTFDACMHNKNQVRNFSSDALTKIPSQSKPKP